MADTATALQEEIFTSITTMQDAALKLAKSWTKTLATLPMGPTELLAPPKADGYYAFAEKLWNAEKNFVVNLMEIATEAGKTVPEHVKRAATAATPTAK